MRGQRDLLATPSTELYTGGGDDCRG